MLFRKGGEIETVASQEPAVAKAEELPRDRDGKQPLEVAWEGRKVLESLGS